MDFRDKLEFYEDMKNDTKYERKFDKGKTMYHLIPLEPFEGLAEIFTYGYNKYAHVGEAGSSWREVEPERYESAMWRHWVAYKKGEEFDKESNLPHIWHFLWNAYALTWFAMQPGKEGVKANHYDDCECPDCRYMK